jgi:hypothetical protein
VSLTLRKVIYSLRINIKPCQRLDLCKYFPLSNALAYFTKVLDMARKSFQHLSLALGRVVEAGDEDVAHHEVDEPYAAGASAYKIKNGLLMTCCLP